MTAIAGFTDGKTVWIGADSAGVDNRLSIRTRTDSKVFRSGQMVMGFTSSFRMGQILQHHLNIRPPYEDEEDYNFMVRGFIPAVKKAFQDHGYETNHSGQDYGGTFLVGYRSKLYQIGTDYQVETIAHRYHACGSGEQVVLGAFHALDYYEMTPEERITTALEAAAEFNAGLRPPFTIIKTPA